MKIGLCSWTLDRSDVVGAVVRGGAMLGEKQAGERSPMQIGFFSRESLASADADAIQAASANASVDVVGVFVAFEGEDYSSIDRIAETGGLGSADSAEDRIGQIERGGKLAAALGAGHVAIHVGTIPENHDHPRRAALLERTKRAAALLRDAGCELLLETGRESADVLTAFIDELGEANVHVNLDPGNFATYGTDDPANAARALRGRVRCVHAKDATSPAEPGVRLGASATIGMGDAQIPRVLNKLRAGGYDGPVLIECNAREENDEAARQAIDYLRSMLP